jgi:phosphoribosylformimino-5-aminoimidazole carboxamide ribotide isomerase
MSYTEDGMEFRPCIDIHNGKVKQIVGGSLKDAGDSAHENFVSEHDAAYFADLYKRSGLKGGHVILLNSKDSEYYNETKMQALGALAAYPGGLQAGGGITPDNAGEFISAGASHVIVTSYVFKDGRIRYDRLKEMTAAVGKEHLVLDVSCRKTADGYMVVTDRWQNMTMEKTDLSLLERLSEYCDEFLIHAVDVEGKADGIEKELTGMLGTWEGMPITYAGGVHSLDDIRLIKELGNNRVNVTIGSALDIFGGGLKWEDVIAACI